MTSTMITRLADVIARDPRSANRISTDAGLGRNYVRSILEEGKSPRLGQLHALLATFAPKDATYVLTGMDADTDDLELLKLIVNLEPDAKRKAIAFFKSLVTDQNAKPDPKA